MVTIKDIAKEANVSYSAVSIVLGERSKPGSIGKETRERIKDIAARMGYSRNAVATNMRSGKTKVIAFISNDISWEYTSKVLEGVAAAIDRNQFFLKLIAFKNDEHLKNSVERLLEQRPSGLILRGISAAHSDLLANIAKSHDIPIAYVDSYPENPGTVNVFSDDKAGMESMVDYMHSLGHRQIAHISNGLNFGYSVSRYQGFCQGLKTHGIAIDDSLFFEGILQSHLSEFKAFIQKIVSGELQATAITADTDFHALTAMTMIQALGKKVPEDISITGYADMSFCQNSFPALTTVRQPFEKMGIAVADELIKVIRGEKFESSIQVPTELVIRDSTGKAR